VLGLMAFARKQGQGLKLTQPATTSAKKAWMGTKGREASALPRRGQRLEYVKKLERAIA
jgi:hypothetical protein